MEKTLLDIMNENLGTNFKNCNEFAKANAEEKLDMKIVGESLFQYIKYQDAVSALNHRAFKVELVVEKDKKK